MICTLCPKRCKVERNDDNNVGFCKAPFSPKLAVVSPILTAYDAE